MRSAFEPLRVNTGIVAHARQNEGSQLRQMQAQAAGHEQVFEPLAGLHDVMADEAKLNVSRVAPAMTCQCVYTRYWRAT